MSGLNEKTVLITGGGSGIGLATARRVLSEGGNVVLAGRNAERLAVADKELDAGDRVLTVPTDVARVADLDELADATERRFGSLDGVFANAGVGAGGPSGGFTEDDFDRVVGANFKGVFFTVQRTARLLNPGASIVLNSSWTVHRGLAPASLYAATKAAVLNLAHTLAAEFAANGVRVNAVTPGHVRTDMFEAITGGAEPVQEHFRSQVALGRIGLPSDIAEAVVFLLSERSSYITGQELIVDGGLLGAVAA